ncbi:hypothetical protein F5880DRAFT_309327 [Lentinula raphanica]|nr:hypothetical protein F5880DRAFT_309327 [Lentinula raphanica]
MSFWTVYTHCSSGHCRSPYSPQIAIGDSIPDGHTVLRYLAEQGSYPSVENVHKALKSLDPAQWEKDVTVSKTLMVFKQTVSGELYMHTDKLLRKSRPEFDRVDLESMILKDLFISVNLRPHQQIRYTTLTKHGYSCLQELRTYVKDTRKSKDCRNSRVHTVDDCFRPYMKLADLSPLRLRRKARLACTA